MKIMFTRTTALRALLAVGVFGMSATSALAGPAVPEFTNGGFEDTAPGTSPSLTSPGWTTFAGVGADEFIEDPSVAFEGNWYFNSHSNLSSGNDNFTTTGSTTIPVVPGQDYTLSGWFRTPSTNTIKGTANIFLVRANWRDANGADLGDMRFKPYDGINAPFIDDLVEDQWVQLSVSGTAIAGASFARISFVFVTPFGEDGTVQVDGLEFCNGTSCDAGGLVGDLDNDGFVGISDLNIILGVWNQNVPPADPAADPSGDGFVGIADLNVVLGNWNAGTPPASSVPEPASLSLLGLGGLAVLRRR